MRLLELGNHSTELRERLEEFEPIQDESHGFTSGVGRASGLVPRSKLLQIIEGPARIDDATCVCHD